MMTRRISARVHYRGACWSAPVIQQVIIAFLRLFKVHGKKLIVPFLHPLSAQFQKHCFESSVFVSHFMEPVRIPRGAPENRILAAFAQSSPERTSVCFRNDFSFESKFKLSSTRFPRFETGDFQLACESGQTWQAVFANRFRDVEMQTLWNSKRECLH